MVRKFAPAVLAALVMLALVPLGAVGEPAVSGLRVYAVEPAHFPLVRVRAAPLRIDGMLVEGVDSGVVRVFENGAERPVDGVGTVEAGTQIAIIVDAAVSTLRPGATAKLQRDEAIEAIDQIVTTSTWIDRDKRVDYMMLIMPQGPEHYEVRQPWTNDYARIHNKAYDYEYQKQTSYSPLHAMLVEAIARMRDLPGYEQRAKFVLVFSDGIDRTSAEQDSDVIARAQELGVTILAVGLGRQTAWSPSNLNRMARMTGGIFAAYTGPEALEGMYSAIQSQRTQYEITYRSMVAQSGKQVLRLVVTVGGVEVTSRDVEFGLTVQAPEVRIVNPPSGITIKRTSKQLNADRKTLEPRQVPLEVEIAWPDGHPRSVAQGSYIVDGIAVGGFQPGQPLIWDFSEQPAGTHSVQIEVKDELGLVARSDPLQATLVLPATLKVDWFAVAALGFGVLALGVAVYVAVSQPRLLQNVGQTVVDVVNKTIPSTWRRRTQTRAGSSRSTARACLIDNQGKRYPITSQQVILGRSPVQCDIVLEDPTISRLHARIVEETDGVFKLSHEGGQGGTYVNGMEVDIAGVILKSGDRIVLGDADFAFEVGETAPSTDDTTVPARRGA